MDSEYRNDEKSLCMFVKKYFKYLRDRWSEVGTEKQFETMNIMDENLYIWI